jgi:hypothetical protein
MEAGEWYVPSELGVRNGKSGVRIGEEDGVSLQAGGEGPVEALVLEAADFWKWMDESPRGRAYLEALVREKWKSSAHG